MGLGLQDIFFQVSVEGSAVVLLEIGDSGFDVFLEVLPVLQVEPRAGVGVSAVRRTDDGIGGVYGSLGETATAISYLERALSIREPVIGSKHPDVLTDIDALARLYRNSGRNNEARALELRNVPAESFPKTE